MMAAGWVRLLIWCGCAVALGLGMGLQEAAEGKTIRIPLVRAHGDDEAHAHIQSVRRAFGELEGGKGGMVSFLEEDGPGVGGFTSVKHSLARKAKTGPLRENTFKFLEYHGVVSVNNIEYTALFDTATAHMWIPSSTCTTCCKKTPKSPRLEGGQAMLEDFPGGTWFSGVSQMGNVSLGNLGVAGLKYYQIQVKGHRTLPIEKQDEAPGGCADSIFGLGLSTRWSDQNGPSRISQRQSDQLERDQGINLSFVDLLFHEHLITAPLFSLYLSTKKDKSVLEMGSIDRKRVSPKHNPNGLFYVPAVGFPDFRWAFNVPRICFGDTRDMCASSMRIGNMPAHISSAAPYIALPQQLYDAFRSTQGRVINPCAIMDDLPLISFVTMGSDEAKIGNRYSQRLTLAPSDYVIKNAKTGECDFAVVPSKLPYITLGTPFLRKFFTVFHIEKKMIGFAVAFDQAATKKKTNQNQKQIKDLLEMAKRMNPPNEQLVAALSAELKSGEMRQPPAKPSSMYEQNFPFWHHKRFVN